MKVGPVFIVLLGVAVGLGGGVVLERTHPLEQLDVFEGLAAQPAQVVRVGPKILYWWDPMIPDFKSDKPGKSPMGMDMVPVYEGQEPGGGKQEKGVVTVSAAAMNNLGVRTAAVERTTLTPAIETFGTVEFDGSRTTHLHVRNKGWIERIQTRVAGEAVERGQVLFEFFSPELISASYEFLREVQRGDSDIAGLARRKLLALGVADRQIEEIRRSLAVPDRIKVYAPQSGVVESINIAEGMYLEPEDTLMSIVDHSSVWVMAEVFESQAGLVFPGMGADVHATGQPGRKWTGAVDYVYPELKPDTRTVRLRIRLDNPDHALRHGMFASVRLATRPRANVLAIPNDALIRTGRAERVVLAMGDGRFKPVPVKAGLVVGDRTEIAEGLKEGDRVVTSAQFLIDSESSLSAGLARMQEAEPAKAAEAKAGPQGEGEVKSILPDGSKITISHGPIPEFSWPAMTMEFTVGPGVSVQGIAPGDRVRFGVAQAPDGTYTATAIERRGGAGKAS